MIKTHLRKKTKLGDNFFFFTLNLKTNGATKVYLMNDQGIRKEGR